ncbi:MAG: phosphodiester glycosidase family protein [Acidobacteriota bacterium]
MTLEPRQRHRISGGYKPQPLRGLLLLGVLLILAWSQLQIPFAHSQIADSPKTSASSSRFSLKFQEIAPGIEYGQATTGEASKDENSGPWFVNVLRIDPARATIKIVRALDAGVGMETVSSLAARHRATAAINGGYFRTTGTYRGESIGLLLLDDKLISEPHNDRAEFGLIDDGKSIEVIFGHLGYAGEVSVGRAKHKVQGLNRPVSKDELVVFTPEFHRTTLTKPDGIEVAVRKNRVFSIADFAGSARIPADGYVISAVGSAREWVKRNVRKGSLVKFWWRLRPLHANEDQKWRKAHNILGAGPQLIKGGKIDITDKQEKMAAGFATDRHPRTALARLGSGKILLLTVDGRQPGVSVGMSLQRLAELLREFDAVEAINLDGGGSTTMVVQDRIVNRPSDQTGERPVSDAILVFSKPK